MLERAAGFIEANQVLENTQQYRRFFRHPSRGGWPFSTRDHGWPISDCTAEGVKASLLLDSAGFNRVPSERLAAAVELILSLQNRDGGWATYEQTRGPAWLEALNPSDVFANIMVDYSYVECTSACVQALAAYARKQFPVEPSLRGEIGKAIHRGREFLFEAQHSDGSWEGSWGVCFTYGTWFGVWGLLASGVPADHRAICAAAEFLRQRQRPDGGWSEIVESCRRRQYIEGSSSHSVMTSWALLALIAAGGAGSKAVQRGAEWLQRNQGPDGRWPDEPIAGVFNRSCAIEYHAYRRIFPVWALAAYAGGKVSIPSLGSPSD